MKLLEYQAKAQFARAGIPAPDGKLASTAQECEAAARELGRIAVKAQVPVGGRGKAGGIAVVDSPADAREAAERILALEIKGYKPRVLWCEPALAVKKELYLGVTLDRDRRNLVIIFSVAGGMDIEQVAVEAPQKIAKLWPDPFRGPSAFELRELFFQGIGATPGERQELVPVLGKFCQVAGSLYNLCLELDALTCEINPLVITEDGRLVAADGKLETDENADFRQRPWSEQVSGGSPLDEMPGEDPYELEAKRRHLTYVHLNGNIGCIGNGAGLVMNTLDLVKQHGGEPANFLDVGGGANAEKVRASLEMVLLDPAVQGVFINIFGGITRCDEVAKGIIAARDQLKITKPLVVRMTGTREAEGRELLAQAGITPAQTAAAAAEAIVAKVGA